MWRVVDECEGAIHAEEFHRSAAMQRCGGILYACMMPRQTVFQNVHPGLVRRVLIRGLVVIAKWLPRAHSSGCLTSTRGLLLVSETRDDHQTWPLSSFKRFIQQQGNASIKAHRLQATTHRSCDLQSVGDRLTPRN